jgi:DNA-binding NarL/FixJ family response regulator
MQKSHSNSQRSTSSRGVAMGNGHRDDRVGSAENGAKPEKLSLLKPPITPPIKRKVLIAHTTPLVRFGLASLINASRRFATCGQTDAAPIARAMFAALQPHVVLIGLTLQCGDGFELIRDFRRMNSAAGVLVVSARNDLLSIHRAFRAGARGYATTSDDAEEILGALKQIASGRLYASASVLPRLLEHLANGEIAPSNSELNALSDRELQVFSLIGRGFGVSRLADELHLSVKTIETYQMHLKQKLGLRTAAELSEKATHWVLGSMRRNLRLKKQLGLAPALTLPAAHVHA